MEADRLYKEDMKVAKNEQMRIQRYALRPYIPYNARVAHLESLPLGLPLLLAACSVDPMSILLALTVPSPASKIIDRLSLFPKQLPGSLPPLSPPPTRLPVPLPPCSPTVRSRALMERTAFASSSAPRPPQPRGLEQPLTPSTHSSKGLPLPPPPAWVHRWPAGARSRPAPHCLSATWHACDGRGRCRGRRPPSWRRARAALR